MSITCLPFEYEGFVLLSELKVSSSVTAVCEELDFSRAGLSYNETICDFKNHVDEVLSNQVAFYSDAEKELDRLRFLLKEEPVIFYGTRQVEDLLDLAEDLLAAFKKEEVKENSGMKEYHKQLDRLADWDKRIKYSPTRLQQEIIDIHLLFKGVFEFSLTDVKKHYFERANKEGN